MNAPFGGYKRSGNGREWGQFGFDEYLETKAALGYVSEPAGVGPAAGVRKCLCGARR